MRIRDEALVRISFEGFIVEVADDLNSFMVELEAVGNVLVHLTGETETTGDLVVGASVRVVGTVEPDLLVSARKVLVQLCAAGCSRARQGPRRLIPSGRGDSTQSAGWPRGCVDHL